MALHLSKVAVGCTSLDMLAQRVRSRTANQVSEAVTRYRPTRHAELAGGSLYWIVKHRLVARQDILGFEDRPDGRVRIVLGAALIPVQHWPKRAHQGWRYLAAGDAPPDLGDGPGADALPPDLAGELAELALI